MMIYKIINSKLLIMFITAKIIFQSFINLLFILKMSIHFGTSKQQSIYFQLLQTLITALIRRLNKFYRNQKSDQNLFKQSIQKLYASLHLVEQSKHVNHIYSPIMCPLLEQLKIKFNQNNKFSENAQNNIEPASKYLNTARVSQRLTQKYKRIFSYEKNSFPSSQNLQLKHSQNLQLKQKNTILSIVPDSQKIQSYDVINTKKNKNSGYILKQNINSLEIHSERNNKKNSSYKKLRKHRIIKESNFKKRQLNKKYEIMIQKVVNAESYQRQKFSPPKQQNINKQSILNEHL